MFAYLHFGKGDEPRQTVKVPAKRKPMRWHERGLSYTASGYGARIPSTIMVQWEGRWRRVYVRVYGNSGTAYIGKSGDWLATVDKAD